MLAPPKFSVCHWSMPQASLPELARAVSVAGFRGVGLCEELLGDGPDDPGLLGSFGLSATLCQTRVRSVFPFLGGFAAGGVAPTEREAQICDGIDRLAPFRPASYVVLPGVPPLSVSRAEADLVVVSTLKRLGRVAAASGATIGFEPVHPSIGEIFGYVTSLAHGLDIVDRVGLPAVGLLIDTWHLAEDPATMALTPDATRKVVGIHIGDRAEDDANWCHRTLPGIGCLPVAEVVSHIISQGYTGWFDVEVISDDGRLGYPVADSFWRRDANESARALWQSMAMTVSGAASALTNQPR